MTLPEFLLARIAEDQARAESLTEIKWQPRWVTSPDNRVLVKPPPEIEWQPRLLAECEAKRRILERLASVNDPHSRDWTTGSPGADPEYVGGVSAALEYAARSLALPYADHPDYQQEWKP